MTEEYFDRIAKNLQKKKRVSFADLVFGVTFTFFLFALLVWFVVVMLWLLSL